MSALGSRRLLPVEAWPAIDRRLWNAARGGDYFVTLSPGTARLTSDSKWLLTVVGFVVSGGVVHVLDGASRHPCGWRALGVRGLP